LVVETVLHTRELVPRCSAALIVVMLMTPALPLALLVLLAALELWPVVVGAVAVPLKARAAFAADSARIAAGWFCGAVTRKASAVGVLAPAADREAELRRVRSPQRRRASGLALRRRQCDGLPQQVPQR
jgi:hypothetical protein